jgi:hypothetical protein
MIFVPPVSSFAATWPKHFFAKLDAIRVRGRAFEATHYWFKNTEDEVVVAQYLDRYSLGCLLWDSPSSVHLLTTLTQDLDGIRN